MPTALVTGASSGIGLELTRCAAADRHDLALVGRNRTALEEIARGLSQEFGVAATVLSYDLADAASPAAIARELSDRSITVDVLVNCAGFGAWGRFAEIPISTQLEMIPVNVTAPTHLTALFLPGMLERRRGRILNVASTAGFQPGPLMAVYYATKAYVLSFSQALASETRGSGVTVTALCPGPVHTQFERRAGFKPVPLYKGPFVLRVRDVARAGWDGMMQGRSLVIPGLANRILVQAQRITPRRVVTAVARRLQESRR